MQVKKLRKTLSKDLTSYENDRYEMSKEDGSYAVYSRGTEKQPELDGAWVGTFFDPIVAVNFCNYKRQSDLKFEDALARTLARYGEAIKQMPKD